MLTAEKMKEIKVHPQAVSGPASRPDNFSGYVVCQCRFCAKRYYEHRSQADYKGYCSQKCLHEQCRRLGFKRKKDREYDILSRHKLIGSVVMAYESKMKP